VLVESLGMGPLGAGSRSDNELDVPTLGDPHVLVRGQIAQRLHLAAGPPNLHVGSALVAAQPEGDHPRWLNVVVAVAARDVTALYTCGRAQGDLGARPVSRGSGHQLERQEVVGAGRIVA